jgi:hypothetical protein
VLDAKGGENKGQSNKWISYHLRDFENSRLELLVCSKLLHYLFHQKLASCGEKYWLWKIGGVFEIFDQSLWNDSLYASTCVFDLEIEIWVWFTKTNQVVAKDDPFMPKMNQNRFEFYLKCFCTCSSCFMLCWHKSPKRGRLKGKCALGPFLSILVIECQHKCLNVNLCFWMNKVQITRTGMFLSLSTLVLCTNILV